MPESVTKDEIKQARQANIGEYLKSKGVELDKVGRRFKSKEHDSLVFTDNAYFWNSRQEHGNALDYMTKHMGLDFTQAVKELSSFNKAATRTEPQEFKINDIKLNPNIERAIAYLNKTRNIDYKVIQSLIKNKLLYQSEQNANIVFPIKDEKGNVVGAELNGTLSDRRFKGIAENSAYGYGVSMLTSEPKNLKNYMFFESTIDMLSYINIQDINGTMGDYKDTMFVSMGGLKTNVVLHTLEAFKSNFEPHIFLCVDNINVDNAAKAFCDTACKELKDFKISSMMCSIYPREANRFPVAPSNGKDWNDQLKSMKRKSIDQILSEAKQVQKKYNGREERRQTGHSPGR